MELGNLFLGESILTEFLVDIIDAYLVEFVDGYRDIDNLIGCTDDLGDAREDLAVVDLDFYTDAQAREYGIDNLHKLYLVEERVGAYDIGIALVELTVTTLLGSVSSPYGLYLVAFEG